MQGQAKEAIAYYEQALGAEVLHVQTYGEMPFPCPEALKSRISNAFLRIGESELLLFDAPELPVSASDSGIESALGPAANAGSVVALHLSIGTEERTRRIFEKLEAGGKVIAPLEKVPFSPAFGTVTDRFGVTFILMAQPSA